MTHAVMKSDDRDLSEHLNLESFLETVGSVSLVSSLSDSEVRFCRNSDLRPIRLIRQDDRDGKCRIEMVDEPYRTTVSLGSQGLIDEDWGRLLSALGRPQHDRQMEAATHIWLLIIAAFPPLIVFGITILSLWLSPPLQRSSFLQLPHHVLESANEIPANSQPDR